VKPEGNGGRPRKPRERARNAEGKREGKRGGERRVQEVKILATAFISLCIILIIRSVSQ